MQNLPKWGSCSEEVTSLFAFIIGLLVPSQMTTNGIQVLLTASQNSDLEFSRQSLQTSV